MSDEEESRGTGECQEKERMRKVHELMIDYSIHFLEQEHLLIAHMRYIGNDYEGDMAQIGKSEATQKWWKVCLFRLRLMVPIVQQCLCSLTSYNMTRRRTTLMSR